jgi:hypothetical protein
VLSVGGFLGMGSRLVVVPYGTLEFADDKVTLPGGSRDGLMMLPEIQSSRGLVAPEQCDVQYRFETEARVTKTPEAISERVQSATAATAAVGRAEKVLDDAGEAAQQAATQQAWSEADGADNPFIGCAIGYVAGWWIHGRR